MLVLLDDERVSVRFKKRRLRMTSTIRGFVETQFVLN